MGTQTTLITYDDYRNLPDDRNRYEIIEGELLMTPAPNTIHQRISQKLSNRIYNFVEEKELGEVFSAPFDVIFSMTDVVQPDILFISKKRSQIITEKNIVAAPDLIVEILSESTETIDRNSKKTLYEKYEVKEYWIVDPKRMQIEQYVLQDEAFVLQDKLSTSEKLNSEVIPGLTLRLEEVFPS